MAFVCFTLWSLHKIWRITQEIHTMCSQFLSFAPYKRALALGFLHYTNYADSSLFAYARTCIPVSIRLYTTHRNMRAL